MAEFWKDWSVGFVVAFLVTVAVFVALLMFWFDRTVGFLELGLNVTGVIVCLILTGILVTASLYVLSLVFCFLLAIGIGIWNDRRIQRRNPDWQRSNALFPGERDAIVEILNAANNLAGKEISRLLIEQTFSLFRYKDYSASTFQYSITFEDLAAGNVDNVRSSRSKPIEFLTCNGQKATVEMTIDDWARLQKVIVSLQPLESTLEPLSKRQKRRFVRSLERYDSWEADPESLAKSVAAMDASWLNQAEDEAHHYELLQKLVKLFNLPESAAKTPRNRVRLTVDATEVEIDQYEEQFQVRFPEPYRDMLKIAEGIQFAPIDGDFMDNEDLPLFGATVSFHPTDIINHFKPTDLDNPSLLLSDIGFYSEDYWSTIYLILGGDPTTARIVLVGEDNYADNIDDSRAYPLSDVLKWLFQKVAS